jgi:hypothetical protein
MLSDMAISLKFYNAIRYETIVIRIKYKIGRPIFDMIEPALLFLMNGE